MKNLFKKILAVGLAAAMSLGMAVTSFAGDEGTEGTEETTETEVATPKFLDAEKEEISVIADGLWLAGSMEAVLSEDSEKTTDLSKMVIYTDAEAPEGGKVIVGVTKSDAEAAAVSKGKVTKDTDADNILKASYKAEDSSITLKPNKAAGTVKVWAVVLDAENEIAASASITVTVKSAANKISFYEEVEVPAEEEDGEATTAKNTLKSVVIPVGSGETISFEALGKDNKVTEDASYTYEIDEKFADNIEVTEITENSITVNAIALDKDGEEEDAAYVAKVVKTKVAVICKESGKKATITVTVTNPATDIAPAFAEDSASALLYEKDTATVVINAVTADENMPTTDKVKVYVAAPAQEEVKDEEGNVVTAAAVQFGLDENGKLTKFTKSKAVAAKLNADGTVTLTRKECFEEAEIWLVYTDSATKELKLEKLAFIEKVIPTEGDIALGNNAAASYAE